jgi:hypothetical protein
VQAILVLHHVEANRYQDENGLLTDALNGVDQR